MMIPGRSHLAVVEAVVPAQRCQEVDQVLHQMGCLLVLLFPGLPLLLRHEEWSAMLSEWSG